ncbi:MAG: hypothetical protein R3C18_13800 [Planctomycetaceae bacterium]
MRPDLPEMDRHLLYDNAGIAGRTGSRYIQASMALTEREGYGKVTIAPVCRKALGDAFHFLPAFIVGHRTFSDWRLQRQPLVKRRTSVSAWYSNLHHRAENAMGIQKNAA